MACAFEEVEVLDLRDGTARHFQAGATTPEKHRRPATPCIEGVKLMGLRSSLYTIARLMGDANAVKKGKVGKRVARVVLAKSPGMAWASYSSEGNFLYHCLKLLSA